MYCMIIERQTKKTRVRVIVMRCIYTIGYGQRKIADFIAILRRYDIKYLVDVRSQPYSRIQPDYSREALDNHLRGNNMRYVFMGDQLGGRPSDTSCYDQEGRVDYKVIKTKFFFTQGLDRLEKASLLEDNVVIMCSEGKPHECHRSKLIGEALLSERHIDAIHIDERGEEKTHKQVMGVLENSLSWVDATQLPLFHSYGYELKSNKVYKPKVMDDE